MKLPGHKHLKRQLKVQVFSHFFTFIVHSLYVLMHKGDYPHMLVNIVLFSEGPS